MARAPDITKQTFHVHGAQAFADFIGTGTFELSQGAEHSAMPNRDAALRDPNGGLSDIDAKISTQVSETVSVKGDVLTLDGWHADVTTASPHIESPRWSFQSPAFSEPPQTWRALYAKLLVVPGQERDFTLENNQRATVKLYRFDTFDMNNKPVVRWMISVAFGLVVLATDAKKSGC